MMLELSKKEIFRGDLTINAGTAEIILDLWRTDEILMPATKEDGESDEQEFKWGKIFSPTFFES